MVEVGKFIIYVYMDPILLLFQLFVSTCSNNDMSFLLMKHSEAFVVDVCYVKWCVSMNKWSYQEIGFSWNVCKTCSIHNFVGLYFWVWILLLETKSRHVLFWWIDVCCLCYWTAITLLAHVVLSRGTLIFAPVWVSFMLWWVHVWLRGFWPLQ